MNTPNIPHAGAGANVVHIDSGDIAVAGYLYRFGHDGTRFSKAHTRFWGVREVTKSGLPDRRTRGDVVATAEDAPHPREHFRPRFALLPSDLDAREVVLQRAALVREAIEKKKRELECLKEELFEVFAPLEAPEK